MNSHQKKGGVAIVVSGTADFRIRNVTRNEEGCSLKKK